MLNLEKLILTYQQSPSENIFQQIFSLSKPAYLKFLTQKGLPFHDAEDLLQDYFIHEFQKSILRYHPHSECSFFNYSKRILLLRFFSFLKKQKLLPIPFPEFFDHSHDTQPLSSIPSSLIQNEIKDFFRNLVLSIQNPKHRNALILKFCIPIPLSNVEITQILHCSYTAFSTWLTRAVHEIRLKIKNSNIQFSFPDVLALYRQNVFFVSPKTLDQIQNPLARQSLFLFLFSRKNQKQISQKLKTPPPQIVSALHIGFFELLKLLNQKQFLFRKNSPQPQSSKPTNHDPLLHSLSFLFQSKSSPHSQPHSQNPQKQTPPILLQKITQSLKRYTSQKSFQYNLPL